MISIIYSCTSSHEAQLVFLSNLNYSALWWQGGERHNQLLSIDEETVYLWDIDASARSLQVSESALKV